MVFVWTLCVALAALGGLVYNASSKYSADHMNVYGFALVLQGVGFLIALTSFLVARFGFNVDVMRGMDQKGIVFAAATGLGALAYDVAFNAALRGGSLSKTQTVAVVGSVILTAIFSTLVFKEAMSPTKMLGIAFGIASVCLMLKAS